MKETPIQFDGSVAGSVASSSGVRNRLKQPGAGRTKGPGGGPDAAASRARSAVARSGATSIASRGSAASSWASLDSAALGFTRFRFTGVELFHDRGDARRRLGPGRRAEERTSDDSTPPQRQRRSRCSPPPPRSAPARRRRRPDRPLLSWLATSPAAYASVAAHCVSRSRPAAAARSASEKSVMAGNRWRFDLARPRRTTSSTSRPTPIGGGSVWSNQRENLAGGVGLEGIAAGQHLVGDHGERELIRRAVRVRHAPLDLLGRHVERRAHHRPLGRLTAPARALHLRNPEVQDLDRLDFPPLDRHEEHVVRLEIAVNDARGVGRRQPRRDLVDDSDDGVERKRRRRAPAAAPGSRRRGTP